MSKPEQSSIEVLQLILSAFEKTLKEEQDALAQFDYKGIDSSAQQKLELQSELEFALSNHGPNLQSMDPKQVEPLKSALRECRTLAKNNESKILAYQKHIKQLQVRLSGTSTTGYGPKRRFMAAPSCSQPVLTDSVG